MKMLKNKKFLILAAVAVAAVIALVVILTGGEDKIKNPVNINDYLIIEENGYDSTGTLHIDINFYDLVNDHADKLTGETPENETPYFRSYEEVVYEYAYDNEVIRPVYEETGNLKNGDQVQITWEVNKEAMDEFLKALDITPVYEDFTYTVENLPPMVDFDPFENLRNYTRGYNGEGTTHDTTATVTNHNGDAFDISINVSSDMEYDLKNGDTVHATLRFAEDIEYYRNMGINMTRIEADLPVVNLSLYAADAPDEILSYLTQDIIDVVNQALENKYSTYAGTITYEYIGAIVHYSTEEDLHNKNRITFVYHVDNGIYPGGWYTYMTPTSSVGLTVTENEDGTITKEMQLINSQFRSSSSYYETERKSFWSSRKCYFTYEDLYYEGSLSIEECIQNLQIEELGVTFDDAGNVTKQTYNHAIATEALQAYAY